MIREFMKNENKLYKNYLVFKTTQITAQEYQSVKPMIESGVLLLYKIDEDKNEYLYEAYQTGTWVKIRVIA